MAPGFGWCTLPRIAQLYVTATVMAGAVALIALFPLTWPDPVLFPLLVIASCLTSTWKVNLPIPLASGSTLSVSYAADLTALLLLGAGPAVMVALAGAWTQCTFNVRQREPLYRTAFSLGAIAITMWATGLVYGFLGGTLAPQDFSGLPKPLLGAIGTYFVVNTGMIAVAIAFSTRQSAWKIWQRDFLWSGTSFVVAATAGAIAAIVIARGAHWHALLMIAPVYLIYRTYLTIIGRLEDQRRHLEETHRLHDEAVIALAQARKAELALTAEKERLAVTLRSIADGVIVTDAGGRLVLINNVAEEMTGWASDAAIGKPLGSVFHSVDPESRVRCDNSVAALTSAPPGSIRRSSLLLARDSTERRIEESAATLCDDHGHAIGMVLVFRDISDALKVIEERARANKLSALGLLAGGMANDFNNILTSIIGNVSMARTTMTDADPAAAALVEAQRACIRARQLTWQLLTFSKGGIPTRKTVELPLVLADAAATALRGTNLRYTLDIAQDLWTVDADESQLVQVFTNVLLNASEAMLHGGSIEIRAGNVVESEDRLEHALRVVPGRYVSVSVTDTGTGIPPEHLAKIFDPYFTTKNGGSGLGLATTHSIIKSHGGFVTVQSQAGIGTTMRISVPASAVDRIAEPWEPGLTSAKVLANARRSRRQRVLVMDDEPEIRRVTGSMLEFLGYQAEIAETGTVAVERFRQALEKGRPFDVVLLDLLVPGGMGGRETMDRLARLAPSVKAVLVSGYVQQSQMAEYRDYGFGAVITKPFTLDELSTTLRAVLAPTASRVH
ncbi:MAG TPA: ATP-binding protein [Vicinamibacterales bacterium]